MSPPRIGAGDFGLNRRGTPPAAPNARAKEPDGGAPNLGAPPQPDEDGRENTTRSERPDFVAEIDMGVNDVSHTT